MLSKIACHSSGCFEKEAHNQSNQTGQHKTNFQTRILETVSLRLAGGFQSLSESANDSLDCNFRSEKNTIHHHAIFIEDLFDSFRERPRPFSFRNLSLQTPELLVSFCHPDLCGFFV